MQAPTSPPSPTRVSFLTRLGSWLRGYLIVMGLILSVLLFLLIYGISLISSSSRTPPLADNAHVILRLDLAGEIQQKRTAGSFFEQGLSQLLGAPLGPYPFALKNALRHAAKDPRIAALSIELDGLQGSLADFDELRSALLAFKSSGKKIYLWAPNFDTNSFFLASAADKIFLSPAGDFAIFGPSFQLFYMGKALEKLGVEINVVRTGTYKSAFEGLISNKPSTHTEEMYSSLTADHTSYLCSSIQKSRALSSPHRVKDWFTHTFYDPPQALSQGLIDALAYSDEAKKLVEKDQPDREFYEFTDYVPPHNDTPGLPVIFAAEKDGIALIEAQGEIHLGNGSSEGGAGIFPEIMTKKLRWALEDEHVKGVVLHVVSPGGSALASDLIWHQVALLAEQKPLVVAMGAYAASGGYYIAAPAKKIFALPTTLTGSIGVISLVPNIHGFEEKYGINFHTFAVSAHKALLSMSERPSDADKMTLAARSDFAYQRFAEIVAKGRSMPLTQVHALAEGRVWTGLQAKERGLVDEIGDLHDAVQEAKKLAGFDSESLVPILQWPGLSPSLPTCLTNPRSCLPRSLRSSALGRAAGFPADFSTSAEGGVLIKAAEWLSHCKKEPIQAFWPGYWHSVKNP